MEDSGGVLEWSYWYECSLEQGTAFWPLQDDAVPAVAKEKWVELSCEFSVVL